MLRRLENLAGPALHDLERTAQSYDPKNAQRSLKIALIGNHTEHIYRGGGGGGGGRAFLRVVHRLKK